MTVFDRRASTCETYYGDDHHPVLQDEREPTTRQCRHTLPWRGAPVFTMSWWWWRWWCVPSKPLLVCCPSNICFPFYHMVTLDNRGHLFIGQWTPYQ